jgi:phosphatidylglycerophosphate synthase
MNLHRAEKKSDWESIIPTERSAIQKIAAKSKGIATPGNLVSLAGLLLTHSGLKDIKNSEYSFGTAKIALGRALDVVDGYVADKTKTKSSVGEAVDAGVDKLLIADALYTLRQKDVIPSAVIVTFGIQNAVNTVATGVAKVRGIEIHSSREGKLTTAMQWAAIGGYCLDAALSTHRTQEDTGILNASADIVAVAASSLGSYVNADYIQTAVERHPAVELQLPVV